MSLASQGLLALGIYNSELKAMKLNATTDTLIERSSHATTDTLLDSLIDYSSAMMHPRVARILMAVLRRTPQGTCQHSLILKPITCLQQTMPT